MNVEISYSHGPTGDARCPKCHNSMQNEAPSDAPNLLRCATCKIIFRKMEAEDWLKKHQKSPCLLEECCYWGNQDPNKINQNFLLPSIIFNCLLAQTMLNVKMYKTLEEALEDFKQAFEKNRFNL